MSARGFGEDDKTQPDTQHKGAPEAELDLRDMSPLENSPTAPVQPGTKPIRAPAKKAGARMIREGDSAADGVWKIYEAALRAWGKMTATGAPEDVQHVVVNGCAQLRLYLQSLGTPRLNVDDERRAADAEKRVAMVAVKVKGAIDSYEAWLAQR